MSVCYTCGFENPEGSEWCSRCGTVLPIKKIPPPPSKFPQDHITKMQDQLPSAKAKWALTLAIFSVLLLFMTGIGAPIAGIPAGILGGQDLKRMKTKGFSSAGEFYSGIGVWCGYITSCMSVLILCYLLIAGAWILKWFQDAMHYR